MSSYIPYAQRTDWSDVTPLPQKDADGGLVPIMYSDEYRDVSSYFRAISHMDPPEYSQRALEVTEHLIRLNPAHYTVWQYRFRTLLALQADLQQELKRTDDFVQDNLKNYQVWHHRLLIMSHLQPTLPALRREIRFIHACLLLDTKNYHTWAYLHWLFAFSDSLGRFSHDADNGRLIFKEEVEWVELMLESDVRLLGDSLTSLADGNTDGSERFDRRADVTQDAEGARGDGRNNSAWAWRWYLMVSRNGAPRDSQKEIEYSLKQIREIPHNASAWNYLRGIHDHFKIPFSVSLPAVQEFTSSEGSTATSPRPVPFALEWMADSLVQEGTADGCHAASRLYEELGERWDKMRANYWAYRRSEISLRPPLNQVVA